MKVGDKFSQLKKEGISFYFPVKYQEDYLEEKRGWKRQKMKQTRGREEDFFLLEEKGRVVFFQ